MSYKIAIIEDDIKYSQTLENYLNEYKKECGEDIEFETFSNPLNYFEDAKGFFNIIFLDIEMPFMNGLDAAKKIRENNTKSTIIFITNMAKYAVKGYEVDAMDFLIKPVEYFNFCLKLEKAIKIQKSEMEKTILINSVEGLVKIDVAELLYVESSLHYVIYHLDKGTYKARDSMKNVENKLKSMHFAKCNNSYLVNLKRITKVLNDDIYLGNEVVKISRSKKKECLDAIASFYGEFK